WIIDLTPPFASITSGPPSPTNQTAATFSFSSSESGSFTCKLDARAAAACTSPSSYGAIAAGNHTFTVTASDPAGNVSAPASFAWTIDTTPPVSSIPSGPAALTDQTVVIFGFPHT